MNIDPTRSKAARLRKTPVSQSLAREIGPSVDSKKLGSNSTGTKTATTLSCSATNRKKSIVDVLQSRGWSEKKSANVPDLGYERETRRPLVCLLFILPFLIFYELGSILIGNESTRSGIDQWIHQFLEQIGLGHLMVLPLLAVGCLLAWHHRVGDHWRMKPTVLMGMTLEATALGLILFWAAKAISLISTVDGMTTPPISDGNFLHSAVEFIGSGIYEELLFRLMLLIPVIHWTRTLVGNGRMAVMISVIAVSIIFAAVHYNIFNPAGNQFELASFSFRFVASIVFCVLFLYRGFGVAVGAHIAYDLLTQL